MKKLILLATLGICNTIYSSQYLSYEDECQRRELPAASIMQDALQRGGQHTVAKEEKFLCRLAGAKYNYFMLDSVIAKERYYNPALKDLSDRDKQEAGILIFKISTPEAKV
jgi:hypothetical protein